MQTRDQRKYWYGTQPTNCQICDHPLGTVFVDGATPVGWAILCESCHADYGFGLGIGLGQRYQLLQSGRWCRTDRLHKAPSPPV